MIDNLPGYGLQLTSTLDPDGTLRLSLARKPVDQPGPDEVVVRLEAVPINPSDLMTLLAAGDPADGKFTGTPSRPEIAIPLSPEAAQVYAGRFGAPLEP